RPLELAQRSGGLDPELLDELLSRRSVDVERLGLSSRSIEAEHQLAAKALAKRVLGNELHELPYRFRMAPELELRVDPLLERRQPEVIQTFDHRARERLVVEVGKRCSAPQTERLPKEVRGKPGLTAQERPSRLLGQALEAMQVELP